MIVVDTSAVIAILLKEKDSARYIVALEKDEVPIMAAPTCVELNAVMQFRYGTPAISVIDQLMATANIRIEPFTYRTGDRGPRGLSPVSLPQSRRHLCLCSGKSVPLLFKGNDFSRTDVLRA